MKDVRIKFDNIIKRISWFFFSISIVIIFLINHIDKFYDNKIVLCVSAIGTVSFVSYIVNYAKSEIYFTSNGNIFFKNLIILNKILLIMNFIIIIFTGIIFLSEYFDIKFINNSYIDKYLVILLYILFFLLSFQFTIEMIIRSLLKKYIKS